MWVAGGPGSCVLPGCAQVAPRDADGVPHGLPAWACGLTGQWYVVSGCVRVWLGCVLSSRLAGLTLAPRASGLWVSPLPWGCPHWSVVSQGWPCGHPGPHVYLPWEGAAPGRLRSGASVVGGDTCPNSAPICQHTKLPPDCHPLLVFVNPKSGGLKGRDLLCSFRKLLNPHQVFELTNGGPLPG